MKVKILIVEDELIIAEDMRDMLEDLGYDVVGVTGEPDEAKRLLAATEPDIAMVDITLGVEQAGLQLAEYIAENYHIPFIFCTSHSDEGTVSKATKLYPHGYLVKPFDAKDLFSAIELALANFSKNTRAEQPAENPGNSENLIIKDSIFIKEGHLYVKVEVKDILWLSPDGNYTTIHEKNGKKYLVRIPLKDFYAQLPADLFFRTHRSYVVNLSHVKAINNQNVLIGENEIPLGRNFREELLSRIRRMH